jgi:hypothetical protein
MNNIITFEQAKVLKEAGFNRACAYAYDFNGLLNDRQTFVNTDSSKIVCAPRLFEIFDWLHQEKKIVIDFYFSRTPGNMEDTDLVKWTIQSLESGLAVQSKTKCDLMNDTGIYYKVFTDILPYLSKFFFKEI